MDKQLCLWILVLATWDWEGQVWTSSKQFDYSSPTSAEVLFTVTRYRGLPGLSLVPAAHTNSTSLPVSLLPDTNTTVWVSCLQSCRYSLSLTHSNRTRLFPNLPIQILLPAGVSNFTLPSPGSEVTVLPLEPCEQLKGRLISTSASQFLYMKNATLGLKWSQIDAQSLELQTPKVCLVQLVGAI